MLDLKFIRENKEAVKKNSANRGARVDIDKLIDLDEKRRTLLQEIEEMRSDKNKKSKDKPSPEEIEKMQAAKEEQKNKEASLKEIENELNKILLAVPNMTHPEVKVSDKDDNPVIDQIGNPTTFSFNPKNHVELAEQLDLLDLERGAKVAGSKFYYLKNDMVRLEQALINYALDKLREHGYTLMTTPDLAKTDMVELMGFNPRGESSQIYHLADTDLSLVGTSEITLGAYHADEFLDADKLPLKYAALSHCFRTEAGSYGKYNQGIFRVHQFTKVEMYVFALPESGDNLLEHLVGVQKDIWNGLDISYRVIDHTTADLGNPSYRTFDLEVWLPAKPNSDGGIGDWAEVTSASNTTDYQSRALNIKYKDDKANRLVHNLNATAIATTRALIAIMENYQQADGSIVIPEALRPYMNGQSVIK